MKVKQLSIFLENKPGTLRELTRLLAEKNVNLRAFSVAETQDFGVVRTIVSEPEQVREALLAEGYICLISEVLAVAVDDTPGALHEILTALADAGISIEYTYASLSPKAGRAFLILRVQDNEAAEEALKKLELQNGVETLF